MRYAVSHRTRYVYDSPVMLSHHAARLVPRTLANQRCLNSSISIDPAPTTVQDSEDYFGNTLSIIAVQSPHRTFTVTAESEVEVTGADIDASRSPPWRQVRDSLARPGVVELAASEFIHSSPLVPIMAELHDYAMESFAADRPLLAGVRDLTRRIHADFTYDPKATTVSTPLAEAWQLKRGVCQDFAHLQIGCLRALGLAARYVSGYLLSRPPPGQPRLVGADASHAWLSVWVPADGWVDFDPTNDMIVGEEHIVCAVGRDYHDVSPLKGVAVGGGDHEVQVSVDVRPLD